MFHVKPESTRLFPAKRTKIWTPAALTRTITGMTFENSLRSALRDHRDLLTEEAVARMCAHWRLVEQWGSRLNLTSIRESDRAAWRHYRDSVEPLRVLSAGPWVDMGSGAGYPGIPLAIMRADVSVTLVEPRRKRVSFLKTVVSELALENVVVYEGRSTDAPLQPFAAVVTRATFSKAEDLRHLLSWCRPGGLVIALRKEPSGTSGSRLYSYDLNSERRVMEVWTRSSGLA